MSHLPTLSTERLVLRPFARPDSSPVERLAGVWEVADATLTIPHPLDILIGKLDRLDAKDLKAFERVIQLAGHPTADEFRFELQNAVDLFRPAFDEDTPNRYPENTRRLWREMPRECCR